jgi:hypothetical protein
MLYPREAWSWVGISPTPFFGIPDGVAIHHTASAANPYSFDPAVLRMIEAGEMANGYASLAYHTMTHGDGALAESRPYWAQGAATGGHNGHTIAICFVGYFHPPYNHQPTEAALRAVAAEIWRLRAEGYITPNAIVRPHTSWTAGTQWATACAGSTLNPRVPDIESWSYAAPPAPAVPKRRAPKMFNAYIPFGGAVPTYLIADDGYLVREWPPENISSVGIPQAALDANLPLIRMTGDEWVSILNTGRFPKVPARL